MASYRSAAGLANQYRQELDHLNYSRNNAVRRERELERALEEERFRGSQREHELSRKLRTARTREKHLGGQHLGGIHGAHHVARHPGAVAPAVCSCTPLAACLASRVRVRSRVDWAPVVRWVPSRGREARAGAKAARGEPQGELPHGCFCCCSV